MYEYMSLAGVSAGGRRGKTRRGGGYYGGSGVDPITPFPGVGGRRTRGRKSTLKAKTLRRMLKKKGMKTTGKKATLMKRLHLRGGGLGASAGSAAGVGDSYGDPSLGGNSRQPGPEYAAKVSAGLMGGRRRRRRSSSSSR